MRCLTKRLTETFYGDLHRPSTAYGDLLWRFTYTFYGLRRPSMEIYIHLLRLTATFYGLRRPSTEIYIDPLRIDVGSSAHLDHRIWFTRSSLHLAPPPFLGGIFEVHTSKFSPFRELQSFEELTTCILTLHTFWFRGRMETLLIATGVQSSRPICTRMLSFEYTTLPHCRITSKLLSTCYMTVIHTFIHNRILYTLH